jgi:hypothetical protein
MQRGTKGSDEKKGGEADTTVPSPHLLHRASTSSPRSSDSSFHSGHGVRSSSDTSSDSGSGSAGPGYSRHKKQRASLSDIITNIVPPSTPLLLIQQSVPEISKDSSDEHSASSATPSPDGDADPEAEKELRKLKPPFIDYPGIQKILDKINANPPPPHDYQRIAQAKIEQVKLLEKEIEVLDIKELGILSLYMHSIQEGNSTNNCFKTIRTECGVIGWFQQYGNTRTWTNLRSHVKNRMDALLRKSEKPGVKKPIWLDDFQAYLQVFQQHSGRYWFAFGKTRSEKNFLNNFCPLARNKAPTAPTPGSR